MHSCFPDFVELAEFNWNRSTMSLAHSCFGVVGFFVFNLILATLQQIVLNCVK